MLKHPLKESAVEALVGGILGLPFGVGSSVMSKAQNNADIDYAKQVDKGIVKYDPATKGWFKDQEQIPVSNTKTSLTCTLGL